MLILKTDRDGRDVIEKRTGRNLDWKKCSEFWNAVQKINNPAAYSSPFKQTGNIRKQQGPGILPDYRTRNSLSERNYRSLFQIKPVCQFYSFWGGIVILILWIAVSSRQRQAMYSDVTTETEGELITEWKKFKIICTILVDEIQVLCPDGSSVMPAANTYTNCNSTILANQNTTL